MANVIKIGSKNTKNSVRFEANAITRLIEERGNQLTLSFFTYKLLLFADREAIQYVFSHPTKYIRSHKTLGNASMIYGKNGIGTMQDLTRWKKDREILSPLFSADKISSDIEPMANYISVRLEQWKNHIGKKSPVNLHISLSEMSMGSIVDRLYKGVEVDVVRIITLAESLMELTSFAIFFGKVKLFGLIPMPLYFKFKQTQNEFRSRVAKIVQQSFTIAPEDNFLRYLAKAWGYPAYEKMDSSMKEHIHCEATTFLVATYVGVPELLEAALSLLSTQPMLADKFYQEVNTMIGQRVPSYNDLNQLTFTRAMIQEIFRLYPPVKFILREAVEDDVIQGCPIKKGDFVFIPVGAIHKLSTYWDNPEGFDPTRFQKPLTPTQKALYMPFGSGERQCLASHLATYQAMLMLVLIAQRYRLTVAPGYVLTDDAEANKKIMMNIHAIPG